MPRLRRLSPLRATSDELLPCQTLLKCGKELSKSVSEPLPDLLKVVIRAILGKAPGSGKELWRGLWGRAGKQSIAKAKLCLRDGINCRGCKYEIRIVVKPQESELDSGNQTIN